MVHELFKTRGFFRNTFGRHEPTYIEGLQLRHNLDLSSSKVILSAHYRLELFERHSRLNMAEKESACVSFKDINEESILLDWVKTKLHRTDMIILNLVCDTLMNLCTETIVLEVLLDAGGLLSHIVVDILRTMSNVRGRVRVIGSAAKTRGRDSSGGRIITRDRSGEQR